MSQTETAAEKKTSSGSSSSTFSRDLTAVYTKATFIGDDINLALSETMAGDARDGGTNRERGWALRIYLSVQA